MHRAYNFNAGPGVLPLPVLEKAREELLDFQGSGMSIMEMSHRDGVFDAVIKSAEAKLRRIMDIPEDYAVLFLPGGASQQFAMIPMNLLPNDAVADYVDTGAWSAKAIREARIAGRVNVIWDGKDSGYSAAPRADAVRETPGSAYVHVCSNETISGVQLMEYPQTRAPLICDMSSDIMSRKVDVAKFGLIYAGAQKNLGPSGTAVVIIRRDLAARCPDAVNAFFRYKTHMTEPSLYNTPNTWAVYLLDLVAGWMLEQGGVAALEERNRRKAALIYGVLDESMFWKPFAASDSRSTMNITWRLGTEELEGRFLAQAKKAGFEGLKGHRSVGGVRASMYNAMPLEWAEELAGFMRDFEKNNG